MLWHNPVVGPELGANGAAVDGAKLRQLRQAAGLSAGDLADKMKVTARSVERAEMRQVRLTTYQRHVDAVRTVLRERVQAFERAAGSPLLG